MKLNIQHKRIPKNIAFFGSFYPRIDRLATTSIGMVMLMSMGFPKSNITILAPIDSRIPDNYSSNVIIENIWDYDNISSLFKVLFFLIRSKKKFDIVFFNLILTSFGKKKLSNGIGLLIPSILSVVNQKKPVVYLHNLIETQNPEKLGYEKVYFSKLFVKLLEKILFKTTNIVVPLESQKKEIEKLYNIKVKQAIFLGVEGIWALRNHLTLNNRSKVDNLGSIRILLFGAWGPQKDIINILEMLQKLSIDNKNLHVTIAGSINQNFPKYKEKLNFIIKKLNSNIFYFIENPDEVNVPDLFFNSDIIILPYNAAGGYSAVMNVASLYCLKIISYDTEDLREISRIIGVEIDFIEKNNLESLKKAINNFIWKPKLKGLEQEIRERLENEKNKMIKILESFF